MEFEIRATRRASLVGETIVRRNTEPAMLLMPYGVTKPAGNQLVA